MTRTSRRIALHGFALLVVFGCVAKANAQEVRDDIATAAQDAGVDPVDLAGAVNTTGLEPRAYLQAVGELAPPVPTCGWPICGAVGQRIYCVEGIESRHGAAMYNPVPWPPGTNSHAAGWLGFIPSTAHTWGVQIGNRVSEWIGAAHMLAAGAGSQFYGVSAGIC